MKATLRRVGTALTLTIAENVVTLPLSAAVISWFQLSSSAFMASWAINNAPFYGALWVKEAISERRKRNDRRFLGFA